jgi:hypothetical protein
MKAFHIVLKHPELTCVIRGTFLEGRFLRVKESSGERNKEKSRREKINDSCRDDLFEALGYITVPPKT